MKKKNVKKVRGVSKGLYLAPRILSILFVLFLSLFALDVFEMGLGLWGTILALFIHLIPSFILIGALIFAWKYELVGGVAFILGGLLYAGLVLIPVLKNGFEWYYLAWVAQISGVAFVIGILWILNWRWKK